MTFNPVDWTLADLFAIAEWDEVDDPSNEAAVEYERRLEEQKARYDE